MKGETKKGGSPSPMTAGRSSSPIIMGGSPSSATQNTDGVDAVPRKHVRKHPAHGVFISINQPTIVFLTVCTKDRQPWLAQQHVHHALVQVWRDANAWLVGRYVLMPDHLHLFCAPNNLSISLNAWVAYWKRQFSCLHLSGVGGWQRDCWDTRLRRSKSYSEKWEYVRQNPVRAGLCANPDEWPYQGELHVLEW